MIALCKSYRRGQRYNNLKAAINSSACITISMIVKVIGVVVVREANGSGTWYLEDKNKAKLDISSPVKQPTRKHTFL